MKKHTIQFFKPNQTARRSSTHLPRLIHGTYNTVKPERFKPLFFEQKISEQSCFFHSMNRSGSILIVEPVDIEHCPQLNTDFSVYKKGHITFGDLHANTMKLIFMLVKQQIITNMTPDLYQKLIDIYEVPCNNQTKENIDTFNGILKTLKCHSFTTIRLLGDEFADRMYNDYYTLCVLDQLKRNGITLEILISNHSIELIEASEKQMDFKPHRLNGSHANSMKGLQTFIEKGLVLQDDVLRMIKTAYKPTLKAVSYTLNEDQTTITLYSHAAIDLHTIYHMSLRLNVSYIDTTVIDIAKTIDKINTVFQHHVENNTVHHLYDTNIMQKAYSSCVSLRQYPFEEVMWNRRYEQLNRHYLHRNYHINYVHGHDSSFIAEEHIMNLDNTLGKQPELSYGLYTALYSQDHQLASEETFDEDQFRKIRCRI
jgi:hypothetical protein